MSQAVTEEKPPLRKRGMATVHITAFLYPDQASALERLAERSDVPKSTLVRHAVARFLADHPEVEREG